MVQEIDFKLAIACKLCAREGRVIQVQPYALVNHLVADHGLRLDFIEGTDVNLFYSPIPVLAGWPEQMKQAKTKKKKKRR